MKNNQRIPQYKVTVVGDGACGKTCLLSVFAKDFFPERHVPTVFDTTVVSVNVAGQKAQLELWDTAGQEDFDRLRPMSYPDSDVILIVFSIANPDSLVNAIEKWLPEVENYCPRVPVILVGTKRDLRANPGVIQELAKTNQKLISQAHGRQTYEGMHSIRAYLECSAKKKEGIREIFDVATRFAMASRKTKEKSRCFCTII